MELHVPARPDHRRGDRPDPEEHHFGARPQHAARAAPGPAQRPVGTGRAVMDLGLSQEQQMLAESVTRLLRELCPPDERSEEHTSEPQSLMRLAYAAFCLTKKD